MLIIIIIIIIITIIIIIIIIIIMMMMMMITFYCCYYCCCYKLKCIIYTRKEGYCLFNDALNTFYLRLYGVRHHMVKDHSHSERGNPLPPHGLLFPISGKGTFICIIPQFLLHQSWSTGGNNNYIHKFNQVNQSKKTFMDWSVVVGCLGQSKTYLK